MSQSLAVESARALSDFGFGLRTVFALWLVGALNDPVLCPGDWRPSLTPLCRPESSA